MSRITRRARTAGAALLLGAVSLAGLTACGGSSGDSAGTDAESETTVAAKAGETATTAEASSGSGSAASADDLSKALLDAMNAVAKGDCAKAEAVVKRMDDSLMSGDLPDMKALAAGMQEVAAKGPSDIKADMKIFADALGQIASTFEKLGVSDLSNIGQIASDPAKMAELEKTSAMMEDPKVSAASDRIDAWIDKKCPGLNES